MEFFAALSFVLSVANYPLVHASPQYYPADYSRHSPSPSLPATPLRSTVNPSFLNSTSNRVKFAGINIAGFDFGSTTDGSCNQALIFDVATQSNGIQQMQHFVHDDGLNTFRLPVAWQYLVNNQLGGPLDPTNSAAYDVLVQGCLNAGAAMCIIDIHNYARWNGQIIGQSPGVGAPNNSHFASLWYNLAYKYKDEKRVAFDIMNEPHDLDIRAWATSCQWAVTSIRNAGAKSQIIFLPGTDYTSAGGFPYGSGPFLLNVTNPGGGTDNLIFNVHQYLDAGFGGKNQECVTNNIDGAFQPLANWLRQNKRVAMLTETGGGPNSTSCETFMCQQNDFINTNSDVYLGVVSWAAGGFNTAYNLSQTPIKVANGSGLKDVPLTRLCTVDKFRGVTGAAPYVSVAGHS